MPKEKKGIIIPQEYSTYLKYFRKQSDFSHSICEVIILNILSYFLKIFQ